MTRWASSWRDYDAQRQCWVWALNLVNLPLLPPWEQGTIARGTLNGFVTTRVDRKLQKMVKGHFDAWYSEAAKATWKTSAELKAQYGSASIVSSERVVFNIKGNDHRLIVAINYHYQVILIIWIGTRKEDT